jgi:hypothetical protein
MHRDAVDEMSALTHNERRLAERGFGEVEQAVGLSRGR